MKTFKNFQKEELTDLNQIQGGKRVKTGSASNPNSDIAKYDRENNLVWIKFKK